MWLGEVRDELRAISRDFEPGVLSGADATEAVRVTTEIENLASSLKARALKRVEESRVWQAGGHVTAGHFLARETGGSSSDLNRLVKTHDRTAELPQTERAVRYGKPSVRQADEISRAAQLDGSAEGDLLAKASGGSLGELQDEARRGRAAAERDERSAYERVHRQRSWRAWTDVEGIGHLHWKTIPDQLGFAKALHAQWRDHVFHEARTKGLRDRFYWYDADAFWEMLSQVPGAPKTNRSVADGYGSDAVAGGTVPVASQAQHEPARRDVQVHVLVSHEALLRGRTEPGERCEMPDVGPIPVDVARRMLVEDDPFVSILATDGVDITEVARPGRTKTAAMVEALFVRDPRCVVPGCARPASKPTTPSPTPRRATRRFPSSPGSATTTTISSPTSTSRSQAAPERGRCTHRETDVATVPPSAGATSTHRRTCEPTSRALPSAPRPRGHAAPPGPTPTRSRPPRASSACAAEVGSEQTSPRQRLDPARRGRAL